MELWGASLYGDPCLQCAFDWTLTAEQAIDLVASAPTVFAAATAGLAGSERADGWSVAEYTSHVADNLRQWAERIQAARLASKFDVGGYDPDRLAQARAYADIPLRVALWSLDLSAASWVEVASVAVRENVVLHHSRRGRQRGEDIARNNAHDTAHHLWDVQQIRLVSG